MISPLQIFRPKLCMYFSSLPRVLYAVPISSAFYGTIRFITVFTTARHWSLSWAVCIQSASSNPVSPRPTLILSSHLRLDLPNGLSPSGVPIKILYELVISPARATCHAHLILIDLITLTISGDQYELRSSSLCSLFQSPAGKVRVSSALILMSQVI
jgi:hypothetical protein